MKWDWYAVTLPDVSPREVVAMLCKRLGGVAEDGRRRLGYAQNLRVVAASGDVLAEVLCGSIGRNALHPHAVATGDRAPDFAQVLREEYPAHSVSRCDAAEDFDEEGAFERLTGVMMRIGADRGVKGLWIKPDDPDDGATYYLGGKSSSVTCRTYQKGLQQRKLVHPALRADISPHWARTEAQIRPPKREGKALAATLTPAEVWGFATWSQMLAAEALALDVQRLEGLGWKPQSDDERAFDFLCRQYGPLLKRVHADLGKWDCVGMQIGHRIAELAARDALN